MGWNGEGPLQPKNLGNISNNICVSLLTAALRVPMGLEGGRAGKEGCVFSFLHMNDSKENAEIDLRWPCMYILKLVVALKWSRGTWSRWRGGGVTGLLMGLQNLRLQRRWLSFLFTDTWGEVELFGECWHRGGCDLRRRLTSTKAGLCKGCRWSPGAAPWGSPGSWKRNTCPEEALRPHVDGITGLLHTLSLRSILTVTKPNLTAGVSQQPL